MSTPVCRRSGRFSGIQPPGPGMHRGFQDFSREAKPGRSLPRRSADGGGRWELFFLRRPKKLAEAEWEATGLDVFDAFAKSGRPIGDSPGRRDQTRLGLMLAMTSWNRKTEERIKKNGILPNAFSDPFRCPRGNLNPRGGGRPKDSLNVFGTIAAAECA